MDKNNFIFLLLIFFPLFSYPKYSLITKLSNESCQHIPDSLECLKKNILHHLIDDVHLIYDFSASDQENNLLNELEKLPVTIHFHNGHPSEEFCLHLAYNFCNCKMVIISNENIYFNENLEALIFLNQVPKGITICNTLFPPISNTYSTQNDLRVSLITSLYKGDDFVHDFMQNMIEQTFFSWTELIIINAHSPENEEQIILPYLKQYSNIRYIRLSSDPGLYAVWNKGIRYAQAPLIGNANLDDRRELQSLEKQVKMLQEHQEYDLAYFSYCITIQPNDQWYNLTDYPHTHTPEFSRIAMQYCLPGPQPVWRKSMHDKYGYFREDFFSAADQEMWCRAVHYGSQFIKVEGISGIYYMNPKGISTDPNSAKTARRIQENNFIWQTYSHLWS